MTIDEDPEAVGASYIIRQELQAREAQLKEAKRALKKAKKMEKQLDKGTSRVS